MKSILNLIHHELNYEKLKIKVKTDNSVSQHKHKDKSIQHILRKKNVDHMRNYAMQIDDPLIDSLRSLTDASYIGIS